jgi:hypothetical protein
MATLVPEWEINEEAEQLVAKLVEMYPEKFGHISADAIGCAQITNKDKSESADWDSKINGITEPVGLYTPKRYIIWWHKDTWDKFAPAQKSVEIVSNLLRIPDPMDGSLLKQDLKDHKCLVRSWGVDYKNNVNLPDLAEVKQVF